MEQTADSANVVGRECAIHPEFSGGGDTSADRRAGQQAVSNDADGKSLSTAVVRVLEWHRRRAMRRER